MKVSAVIPHSGREDHLALCLSFLKRQTMDRRDYEVIVAGHISEDRTDIDRNSIKYLSISGEADAPFSPAKTRNAGIAAAEGDVLVFLDCDMLLSEDFLERAWNSLSQKSALVFSLRKRLPQGLTPRHEEDIRKVRCPKDEREIARAMLNREYGEIETLWLWAYSHTMCVRREDIKYTGGFFEGFTGWGIEDTELAYRLHRAGVPVECDSDSRCYHVWHREAYDKKRHKGYEENLRLFRSMYDDELLDGLELCFNAFNTAAAVMSGGLTFSYVCGLCMFEAYAKGLISEKSDERMEKWKRDSTAVPKQI